MPNQLLTMQPNRRRRGLHRPLLAFCALFAAASLVVPISIASAQAPVGTVVSHPGVAAPAFLVEGPDGAMWITSYTFGTLSRMTADGTITNTYSGTDFDFITRIVVGGDGNLWFLQQGLDLVRMTTAGTTTVFSGPDLTSLNCIAVAPDGTIWVGDYANSAISHVALDGTVLSTHSVALPQQMMDITVAADGRVLIAAQDNEIVVMATDGQFSTIDTGVPGAVYGLDSDPDGTVWFTINAPDGAVGRIDVDGTVTLIGDGSIDSALDIARDADGNHWTSNGSGGSVSRIAIDGTLETFPVGGPSNAVAPGPERTMWFTLVSSDLVAAMSIGDAPIPSTTTTTSIDPDPVGPSFTG